MRRAQVAQKGKMMKIPNSVRIGGVEYTVKREMNLNDGVNMLFGRVEWEPSEILLKYGMGQQHSGVTLWHEIVHAMLYHGCAELDEETEERVAEVLGLGIYQVLEDNHDRFYAEGGRKA